ncbi:hypothetical protein VNO77_39132 [Canavalia gladiata]|uniref:Zinc finger PHD-type domain-containing protein n=1 Tax=Canavalia gladiata TaxID=3824 RepID=A0AAN9PWV4_CANGL
MSSSKDVEKKNKEILVYQRRRKGTSTSGKKASHTTENVSVALECCSLASTDDKVDQEIRGDGVSKVDQEIEEDDDDDDEIPKVDRAIGEDGDGDLLCCDTCPRAYHIKCLALRSVPDGDWQCPKCWFASLSKPKGNSSKKTKPN